MIADRKTCTGPCGRDLPLEDFYKDAKIKSGLRAQCKVCDNDRRENSDNAGLNVSDYFDEPIPEPLTRAMPVPPVNYDDRSPLVPAHIWKGLPIPNQVEQPGIGMWTWKSPKGWHVFAVHHSADPSKRVGTPAGDAWYAKAKAMSSDRDWMREMDGDYTISVDQPFFPNFSRPVHVKPCAFDPTKTLLRGWDFGQGHPAIVWAQIGEHNQLRVLYSILETNKKIWDFAEQVIAETNGRFPGAKKITDYGDPAGAQESDKGSTTAILLERYGINIYHQWSYVETGLKMMDMKLRVTEHGTPGMVLDPSNVLLIQGFEGGYVLDTSATGKDAEGRLKNSPKKDGTYDHLMDALRYLILNAYSFMEEKRDDEEAWNRVSLWRTNLENSKHKSMDDALDELTL